MIKFEVYKGKKIAEVSLQSKEANEYSKLTVVSKDPTLQAELQSWLSLETGVLGHFLGTITTPADLLFALEQQKKYDYKILEGEQLGRTEDFGIPLGANS